LPLFRSRQGGGRDGELRVLPLDLRFLRWFSGRDGPRASAAAARGEEHGERVGEAATRGAAAEEDAAGAAGC
jgi:hypothetical protein